MHHSILIMYHIVLSHVFFSFFFSDTSRRPREGEENGLDYYFAMRVEMEDEIRQNRFLEYGEYAGNLYGTTYDAIRTVNRSGKMCVLDINPQVSNLAHNHLPLF